MLYKILLACILTASMFACDAFSETALTVTVRSGDEIAITLDSNATTGYRWELAGPLDENILIPKGSEYLPSKTGRAGAGGKEIWTFASVAKGKTIVVLKYVRPWEKNTAPAEVRRFRVVVQ